MYTYIHTYIYIYIHTLSGGVPAGHVQNGRGHGGGVDGGTYVYKTTMAHAPFITTI